METPVENVSDQKSEKKQSSLWKWLGRLLRLCIVVTVIAASVMIAYHWISNPPVTQRRPKKPEALLVDVMPLNVDRRQVTVSVMGTVVPDAEIQLAARVNGLLVEKDEKFSIGKFLEKGQAVLQIDPKDYELAVRQQEGNLIRAESEVQLEMGQQLVAQREYELLLDSMPEEDTSLLLRKPQLAAKEAAVEIAQVALEKAKLDLERTTINAPFNCVVLERKVDLGSYITPGTPLATLVGTDEFYVEVSVPTDELQWIVFPEDENEVKPRARIYNAAAWGETVYREGVVDELLPSLEARGRMARVRIVVENPLGIGEMKEPSLLLDSFVRAEIDGKYLENAAQVSRTALRGESSIWIMLPDNTLDVRDVDVAWGTSETVYITGDISSGEMLVVSDLAAPIPGTKLRTADMSVGKGNGPGKSSNE